MSLLGSLIEPISDIAGKYMDNKAEAKKMAAEITTLASRQATQLANAQIQVNAEAAKSSSTFVAGARPALMWVMVAGFSMNFIVAPVGNFILALAGSPIVLPMIDMSTAMPMLLGMLGLGGMRSFDKLKGTDTPRMTK